MLPSGVGALTPHHSRFRVERASSALLIGTRSSVGPIEFGTTDLTGTAELRLTDGGIDPEGPAVATLHVPVASLTSGNSLYDAQVQERLEVRRFPTIVVRLRAARALDGPRWTLSGDLTIHGTTRAMSGYADVEVGDGARLRVRGEQVVDLRDFDIALPSVLKLRIFPDVTVRFHLEAVPVQTLHQD